MLPVRKSWQEVVVQQNQEVKKKELFSKVRKGQVRVLIGSTQKMGAGTNVQDKLIATHHLDCAWKPSDLTQRNGRMIRQGNENKKVFVYSYVTEKTFDSYMYQLVEQKQKFISQIMTSKTPEVLKREIAISIPTKYGIIFTQTLKPSFAPSINASKTFIFL